MSPSNLPHTDSIRELAEFWDAHDLTDFEKELEKVTEPVFERDESIQVRLDPNESAAVQRLASQAGITGEELIRSWVRQHIAG